MKNFIIVLLSIMSFGAFAQPTLTAVHLPQYVQGVGSADPAQDRKVPYACRVTASGLLANTTYRYYSRFGNAPTGSTGLGFYLIANQTGNFNRVTASSLAAPGSFGQFTTDATGSYTGWYINEPSSDISFAPGTTLYFRLFLNNGAGGTAVVTRITCQDPITVLGWGTTPTLATAIRSTANTEYTAKNFIMLYDNQAGTGRPVSGTYVESDGTLQGSALNGDPFTAGYAPFYGDLVDGVNQTWGSILPNNLATGLRNISQFSLATGLPVSVCTNTDGIIGSVSTANASGGLNNPLAIQCVSAPLPVSLLSFTATLKIKNKVDLNWKTANEINASNFELQKSVDGGVTFKTIQKINTTGTNSNYLTTDDVTVGTTYYRLKIVDIDAKFDYSNVVSVKVKGEAVNIKLSPNPAGNKIIVDHEAAKAAGVFQIFNMNGAKVLSQNAVVGLIQTTININRLPVGMYILLFENAGEKVSARFEKL